MRNHLDADVASCRLVLAVTLKSSRNNEKGVPDPGKNQEMMLVTSYLARTRFRRYIKE